MATELARRAGVAPGVTGDVFYTSLTRFAGCAATSHEAAIAFGGDDVALRARGDLVDMTRPAEAIPFLIGLGRGSAKLRVLAGAPWAAKVAAEGARADCEVGAELTKLVGLPPAVTDAVLCAFERFDGKGRPTGLAGDEIPPAARFSAVGFAAVMFDALGGVERSVQSVRQWSGRALDPAIAAIFLDFSRGTVAPIGPGRCGGPRSSTANRRRRERSETSPIWTTSWADSPMPRT